MHRIVVVIQFLCSTGLRAFPSGFNDWLRSVRVGFESPFLVDQRKDIGRTTNVADANPDVVAGLLDLVQGMRQDFGDFDHLGSNMCFFDFDGRRPTSLTVPAAKHKTAVGKK